MVGLSVNDGIGSGIYLLPAAAAALLASAGVDNLVAAAVALVVGALIYRFWRRPVNSSDEFKDPW